MNHVKLDKLKLKKGNHASRRSGMCVMEAVAYFAGLPHTDVPECTDAVVAAYAMGLNDSMPDSQRQRLIPYIPRLAGTKNGVSPQTRAFMCADRAVRVFAAMALEAQGRTEDAAKLRAVAPIVDKATALAGKEAAYAAYAAADANAAADAAYAAAYAAVWDEAMRLLDDLIEAGRADV